MSTTRAGTVNDVGNEGEAAVNAFAARPVRPGSAHAAGKAQFFTTGPMKMTL